MLEKSLKQKVERLVCQIPEGRLMTYGQLAALAGSPRAARAVGGIAHFGDSQLPWHRVVNKQGGLASGYPGGRSAHREHLEAEGVAFIYKDGQVAANIKTLIWWPEQAELVEDGSEILDPGGL
jgi:methylated-DNA-protein-cysteine methyltransferase-like protein